MTDKNKLAPTFPVAGWNTKHIPGYEVVALQLMYLSNPSQLPEDADASRHFILTPAQAIELGQMLTNAAGLVDGITTPTTEANH